MTVEKRPRAPRAEFFFWWSTQDWRFVWGETVFPDWILQPKGHLAYQVYMYQVGPFDLRVHRLVEGANLS